MLSQVQVAGFAAEGLLLTFHLSVLACILKERRNRTPTFLSGFFAIYCMQSVADVVDYVLTIVYVRLTAIGYIPREAFDSPQGPIAYFTLAYSVQFQFVAHVAIAFNRFFVLSEAWTARKQRIILASALALPLPSVAIRLVGGMKLVETSVPGIYAVTRDIPWVNMASPMTIAASSFATSVVSFVLELRSLIVYKQLTASARLKYRKEFFLLIYAMLQFAIQLAISVCYGISAYGAVIGDPQVVSVGYAACKYFSIGLCLSPAICLFSTR